VIEEYQDVIDYSIRVMYRRFNKNLIDYLKEDLIQEGYIKLLTSLPGYDEETGVPLRKYLLYYVIRDMAHHARREQHYQHSYGGDETLLEKLFDNSISPYLIRDYMSTLTEKEREVLDRIILGDNITEVAKSIGVRKQVVVDAVANLKLKLEDLNNE